MDIQWKRGSQISDEIISEAELAYGICLPQDIKDIVKKYNNGRPSVSSFDSPIGKEHEIKKLISFKKDDIENIYQMKNLLSAIDISLFPIALDPAGNIICYQNGKIVYWLHETDEVYPLANSFSDFLSKLY